MLFTRTFGAQFVMAFRGPSISDDWPLCATTKMAGRVERRINDRFYFVLDEVGGSSDLEAELGSDNESKSSNKPVNDKGNPSKCKETAKASTSNAAVEDNEIVTDEQIDANGSPEAPDDDLDAPEEFDLTERETESKEEAASNRDGNEELPAPKPSTSSEESKDAVDMDIESEVEEGSQRLPPLIKITFRDETAEQLYKNAILKFLTQKIQPCNVVTNCENHLEYGIYEEDAELVLEEDVLDFDVDTAPEGFSNSSSVPSYSKTQEAVLTDTGIEKQAPARQGLSLSSCFNCMGKHTLRDCPQPKDFRTINKNRLKFQSTNRSVKSSRYHLDESQKFGHFTPGQISKKLKNALSLHREQQPQFIYRMRLLGYPPAWLEEARVSHSGVIMYDTQGRAVLDEDEEEGEIVIEGAKDRFDMTKIIDFPGFNVPLPKNFKDEFKLYQCPPLSEDQSKENMIRRLEPNAVQAYKKRSLSAGKPPQSGDSSESTSEPPVKKSKSPTIEEMEEKKRQLLMALNDDDDTKTGQEESQETAPSTPAKFGTVKNLDFGTPILKSVSPFAKLPAREQFSVNVSDVINFENLPNSTGKYETMTHLITKIRESKMQSE